MGTGDGLYHYYGSWHDDPSIPYASLIGHVDALKAGKDIERPTEELGARARPPGGGVRRAAGRGGARPAFQELLGLSRTVFPYVEEHKFYCDYWFQSRFFNKVREFGALLAQHGFLEDGEDIFNLLAPRGDGGARGAVADLVDRRPAARAAPLAADRRPPPASCSSGSASGRRRRRSARCRRRSTTRSS